MAHSAPDFDPSKENTPMSNHRDHQTCYRHDPPDLAAVTALAPRSSISSQPKLPKLSTEEQTRCIAKVLAAMRGDAYLVPTITLPLPPSVNRRGRAGSLQYDAWRTGLVGN
jgi:hypothetical protein